MTDQLTFDAWYEREHGLTIEQARRRGVYDLSTLQDCWDAARASAPASPDARLAEHAGENNAISESLERLRRSHYTHWSAEEIHTVSTAVRVLRELNFWWGARQSLPVAKDQP